MHPPATKAIRFVLAFAVATAVAARAEVQGFHYTREIAAPAPGWVQAPLDFAAVQHLAPGGADVHLFSPDGAEVPLRIIPASSGSERRPAASFHLSRTADGWLLLVDLGADPAPHQRLFLSPAHPAPDKAESSPDGTAWKKLAVEAAPGEKPGESAVSYPVTGDRYLRLHWPRHPEAPRISAVAVEMAPGPTLPVPGSPPSCREGPSGARFCTLDLHAAGQIVQRLTLDVEGKGPVGYRLYAPRDARWLPLAEGIWQPAAEGRRARHLLEPGAEPVTGAVLRLELYGGGGSRPQLTGYAVDLAAQTVLFQAAEPGTYTLAYGGAPRSQAPRAGLPPPNVRPRWLAPRAEAEHGLPYLPATATAPAVRLESRRLAASWRIVAPSVRPGTLVHLELPDLVYAAARADLGNLRVMSGDHQIPFQKWSPEDPTLVLQDRDLQLSRSGGRRAADSMVEIHLPHPGLPLTQAQLTAPALPLRRDVGARYLEPATTPAREVRRRERPVLVRDTWECRPQPPLPCRELLPLPGRAPSVLEVTVHDGDNPPLAGMGAALWRRRDVLLFVWPDSEEPVRLVAGPDTLTAPTYDLQALGDSLLGIPWQPAEISQGTPPLQAHPWWTRWVRPMTLLLATVVLLVLLRRILGST